MNGKRRLKMKQLTRLFIPICLETLFYMLSGMVDTLMLSAVGDYAVGAVGTANSYIGIFIIMFSIISSGMVSVMTQNIGAGRPGVAYQARQLGGPKELSEAQVQRLYEIRRAFGLKGKHPADVCVGGKNSCHMCDKNCGCSPKTDENPELVAEITKKVMQQLGLNK